MPPYEHEEEKLEEAVDNELSDPAPDSEPADSAAETEQPEETKPEETPDSKPTDPDAEVLEPVIQNPEVKAPASPEKAIQKMPMVEAAAVRAARDQVKGRVLLTVALLFIIAGIGGFLGMHLISQKNSAAEEQRLEQMVSDIRADMEEGRLDEALLKAQNIKYNVGYSYDSKIQSAKWENTRSALVAEIAEEIRETAKAEEADALAKALAEAEEAEAADEDLDADEEVSEDDEEVSDEDQAVSEEDEEYNDEDEEYYDEEDEEYYDEEDEEYYDEDEEYYDEEFDPSELFDDVPEVVYD